MSHRIVLMLRVALLTTVMAHSAVVASDKLILSTQENRPTAFMVKGAPVGRTVDIVTEAFRRAGQPIEIQLMPLARALRSASNGEIDGVFSLFHTPEREKFLLYTGEPLLQEVQSFFVLKGSPLTFDGDLSRFSNNSLGIIIGASHGSRLDGALADGVFSHTVGSPTLTSLIKMLAAGRIDVITSSRESVWETAQDIGLADEIVELSPSLGSVPSYLTLVRARDLDALIPKFSNALKSMKDDGTYDQILARYRR